MSDRTIRAFIALELPLEVRSLLEDVSNVLRDEVTNAKFVSKQNMHITLKFLGAVPSDKLDGITDRLESVSRAISPFEARLGTLGGFPSLKSARILWAGIEQGSEQVIKLAEYVESACEQAGLVRSDQKFHPHITLARVKARVRLTESHALSCKIKELSRLSFKVDHVTVMKSDLQPYGPVYTPLAVVLLSNN